MSRRLPLVLMVLYLLAGCLKKKDPAPVICYLTAFSQIAGTNSYYETYIYDDQNRVIMITALTSGSSPEVYEYTYGPDGNLAEANFGGGVTATYTFDGQNRLILRTVSPSGATTTYTYNAAGQNTVRNYTDPTCSSCGYTYTYLYPNTSSHNYSQLQGTLGSGTIFTVTFEYDDHPNPYKNLLYSSTGTTNNVTKEVFTSSTVGPTTTTTTYTYNDRGYPLSATTSSGNSRTYMYDCK